MYGTMGRLVVMAVAVLSMSSLVSGGLHNDSDTGKWIEDGFDVQVYAQIPGMTNRMVFAPGGSFGTDLYVTTHDRKMYRVNSSGQASLFTTLPTWIHGLAFPNPGSGFGDYMYLGSGDGYWRGNKTIYRMDAQKNIQPFFNGANFLGGTFNTIQFSPAGSDYGNYLFTQDDDPNQIYRIKPDGTATTFSSGIPLAVDYMFDTYGQFGNQLIVSNIEKSEHGSYVNSLYKVASNGTKTTLLGNVFHMGGGVITAPNSVFGGKLYIVENAWPSPPCDIYSVNPDGTYSIFARNFSLGDESNIVCGPDGALYVSDVETGTIYRIVPEPCSLMLMVLGGWSLVRKRR